MQVSKEAQQTQKFKERKYAKEKNQAEKRSHNEDHQFDTIVKNDLECIATSNEFCSVDQMLTPLHASFIDDYEYQKVLMDLF